MPGEVDVERIKSMALNNQPVTNTAIVEVCRIVAALRAAVESLKARERAARVGEAVEVGIGWALNEETTRADVINSLRWAYKWLGNSDDPDAANATCVLNALHGVLQAEIEFGGASDVCTHVRDNAAGICGTCEPEAMKLHLFAVRVVAGFKAWASDEDGVHYQAWDAYQEARQLAGLKPAMTGDEEGTSDGE